MEKKPSFDNITNELFYEVKNEGYVFYEHLGIKYRSMRAKDENEHYLRDFGPVECRFIRQEKNATIFKPLGILYRYDLKLGTWRESRKQFKVYKTGLTPKNYLIKGFFFSPDAYTEYCKIVSIVGINDDLFEIHLAVKTIVEKLPVLRNEHPYQLLHSAMRQLIARYNLDIKLSEENE